MQELLHDIHFRKMFFLTVAIAIAALFVLKYWFMPYFNRREAEATRVLRQVIDTITGLLIAALAVGSVLFWISGND